MRVVVTSGPTRAYIDEIRYISNYSTGKLGSLIASALAKAGHKVSFIYGKDSLVPKHRNIKTIGIETVADLASALKKELKAGVHAVVHAMAVLDYEPVKKINAKVKSDKKFWTVKFKRTPKIIDLVKKTAPDALLIGFKLEYKAGKNGLKKSAAKLFNKSGADFVVANDYAWIKKGEHIAQIMGKDGSIVTVSGKEKIAKAVVSTIENVSRKR